MAMGGGESFPPVRSGRSFPVPGPATESRGKRGGTLMAFRLESPAFATGDPIPDEYTCIGRDISPELHWHDAPSGTRGYALILDDPDTIVGLFTHWMVANLSPALTGLPEGVSLEGLGVEGVNDFRRIGYSGPCPPRGRGVHRYFFRLYALSLPRLPLLSNFTRQDLEREMAGHILEVAELMGTFER